MKRLLLIPLAIALFLTLNPVPRPVLAIPIPRNLEDVAVFIQYFGQKDNIPFMEYATGFLVMDSVTANTFIITNRHVFQDKDSVIVRFNTIDGWTQTTILPLKNKDGTLLWKGHPDSTIDIAIILAPPGRSVRVLELDRFEQLANIKMGDDIYFIGFPLWEYAMQNKIYPLLRHGVVSYISKENIHYMGNSNSVLLQQNSILIDANVLFGNSGSPVLSPPSGGRDKASLVGIIKALSINENNKEKLNLGIVIPAERILETIRAFKTSR